MKAIKFKTLRANFDLSRLEAKIKELCEKLYNETVEPTAANFKWATKEACRALEPWSNGAPTIPCKRDYVEWIPPFINLIKGVEGVEDPYDIYGSIIHTKYIFGSPEYCDIKEAMEMLIPQVKVLIKNLKLFIPDGMDNLDDYWGNQVASNGRCMRKIFYGDTIRHYLNAISVELPRVYAHVQEDNNIIIYNSPSPKGTGIYSNNNTSNSNIFLMDGEEDSADKRKKKVPKKGGGRWQTGPGKKMIDDFLDWRSKDRTATDSKLLAMRVWKNPRYKDFVDKMINHSKGPKASEYTFKSSFYPACIRALNCKIAE